jgi:DNA (cytosine-5)-methyltransferase 1
MKDEQSINNFFLSDGQTALPKLTHGSLFSGIGGFDLAAEWAGFENIFHCEWNEFGQKVLKYYWPNAISYADITKTDFTIHRGNIDVLTGGFPCQPYSVAGKRKGKEDDRHLWPEMLRAIREIAPLYIVGENVGGLVSWNGGMVFDEVQTDLENEGYEIQPVILPACAIGAEHRRDRIWIVAYSSSARLQKGNSELRQINGIPETPPIEFARSFTTQWNTGKRSSGMLCRNNGIPKELDGITFSEWRKESIKAFGNAIVPQVAFEIFKSILYLEPHI